MADITITFDDGKQHVYSGAPDDLQPSDVYSRAQKDFPNQKVKSIDRKAAQQKMGMPGRVSGFSGTAEEMPSQGAIDPYSGQFISGISQADVNRMLSESGKGVLSGVGQVATGAAELLPGEAGRKAAQATQSLREYGYGPSQVLGSLLVPAAGATKAPILAGALYGATAPTGEEDTLKRYGEKGVSALIGGALGATPFLVEKLAKSALGVPTRSTEQLAREWEKRGYQLEPGQLKADKPFESPGFASAKINNQKLANEEAYQTTGRLPNPNERFDQFLSERFDDLGKNYDNIYSRQPTFKIDRQSIQDLKDIYTKEAQIAPGQVRPAMQASANMIDRFITAQQAISPNVTSVNVPSEEISRILSELKRIVRSSSDETDKYIAKQTISAIDDSVIRNHPKIAKELKPLNKKYRATIELSDLFNSGGIQGGNISLNKLGDKIDRLRGSPLYDLALGGKELNISARWEGTSPVSGGVEVLLSPSKLARALATGTGLRSKFARKIQRQFKGD